MQESILNKLEAARRELLDLGLRNPLLNYRIPAGRGLHITAATAVQVFDALVKQGRTMSFLPGAEQAGEEPQEKEAAYSLNRLQTLETAAGLQNRLLNTYYAARTCLEEQGVNILFIALGQLQWYESDNRREPRLAPLVLVPVALERSTARERFRLRYTGGEVDMNLSLQAKLKTEFGLLLPELPEAEEETGIDSYMQEVAAAVSAMEHWKVLPDVVELGFFSFGRFMLYHDLDSACWPDDEQPAHHPVLQSLFESGFRDGQPSVPENAFLDTATAAHRLHQVVDADSSQLLAMLAVQEGKNLVIQGPPGTGKSQTITNLIANAIGEGKKVLFVAEKMAALEVVKRRLDAIQLGEACLELHSHKANKKELHKELRRTLELGRPALLQLQQEVALLDEYKAELNDYCAAVNTPVGESGITPQQLMGNLLQLQEQFNVTTLPRIQQPGMAGWNALQMQRATAMAERMEARLAETGMPAAMLFWGSRLTMLLPAAQEQLPAAIQQALAATETLQHYSAVAAGDIGLPMPLNRQQSLELSFVLQLAASRPDITGINIKHPAWQQQPAAIQQLLANAQRLREIHQRYDAILIPAAWEQPVMEIRANLLAYGDKWYKFLSGSYNRSNRQLSAFYRTSPPASAGEKLAAVDAILEAGELAAALCAEEALATALFGAQWQKGAGNLERLKAAAAYLAEVHRQISTGSCSPLLLDYLERNEPAAAAKQYYDTLLKNLQRHGAATDRVVTATALDTAIRYGDITPLPQRLYEDQLLLLQSWAAAVPEIHLAISWNNLAAAAEAEGLQGLVAAATHWPGAAKGLKAALQRTWYEHLWEQALLQHSALRRFERSSHEAAIREFARLDTLNLQYNRARAALKHWENVPPPDAGGQVNVLRTEFNKKARHMPIRKLMQAAGLAIQAVKPVFMMSPLSIAGFLPPGALQFDLVIFDEASQVRPVDALGALLRGRQLVVVGDSKQLPPTSFFDSLLKETDDEENVTADMPSILGMCDAQGAPQRMLRWHYRSRHESLIALSNHEFYDNRLVIFPSPGGERHMGLVYHHLPDAVYDRGHTRRNEQEAAAIVTAVMDHARQHPQLSLGVVAFSTAQMQAIQEQLEEARRQHPEVEAFFKAHAHEPFFVKNLENVQGDERDVIFISIGYGRTANGQVSLSFGPLNNEGGERRLNVLVTRARQRCEVFTNLTAADIDVSRTASLGVRALQSFLHFAQHGRLSGVESLPAVHTPFETHVARFLLNAGYNVHTRVGSQGFYIDMAVEDPQQPGKYIIGIMCDGASYHSARTARDRDRLRQQVLEQMGWNIYRVWSTDWFRHPEREGQRLTAAIEKLCAQRTAGLADHIPAEATGGTGNGFAMLRETTEDDAGAIPLYETASLPAAIAGREFHLHPPQQLYSWLEAVVRVESPVHIEEATRRMTEAAGLARSGSRVRECIKQAVAAGIANGSIAVKGDFLWDAQMQTPLLRNRAALPAASRRLEYIAPEELLTAIEKVVQDAVAIEAAAVAPLVAKLLGFARVTEELRDGLPALVQQCVEQGMIYRDGEWLKAEA